MKLEKTLNISSAFPPPTHTTTDMLISPQTLKNDDGRLRGGETSKEESVVNE